MLYQSSVGVLQWPFPRHTRLRLPAIAPFGSGAYEHATRIP
jgi:hypothetical protein